MDLLSFNSIIYVAFRLAPFIIVSYFVLSSIFGGDIKGIIFLGMLLINCVITATIGNMMGGTPSQNQICQVLNLGPFGPISKSLPLNINVFGFTFAYMLYSIVKYGLASSNWATLLFFPMLILYQLWWSSVNECSNIASSLISLGIGIALGLSFSASIDASKITEMQYFNGISNSNICKQPSTFYLVKKK